MKGFLGILLCCLPLTLFAQEIQPSSMPSTQGAVPALEKEAPPLLFSAQAALQETKLSANPVASVLLSLAGSSASVALMLASRNNFNGEIEALGYGSMVITPSLGHLYAKDFRHMALMSGLRLGVVGLYAIGARRVRNVFFLDAPPCCVLPGVSAFALKRSGTLIVTAPLALIGLSIYDIIDAARAPKRVQKRMQERAFSLQLTPAPLQNSQGKSTLGVLISGSF